MNSNPTYESLSNVYLKIKSFYANVIPYFNSSNFLSPNNYNYLFSVETKTFIENAPLASSLEVIISVLLLISLFFIYRKMNYKI